MNMENWRPVRGYEGLYEISDKGRVRSLPRNGTVLRKRILKPHLLKSGYWQVELSMDNKMHGYRVHRLVAAAFIPNPENKLQVNHIDGDKENNCVENLEWVTRSENQLHACYVIKTQKMSTVLQKDMDGNTIKKWYGVSRAARAVGIGPPDIYRCCRGARPSAGGYRWEMIDRVHKK